MFFTLGLNKLPFEPDCNQIIYIEGQHDEEVNELIRRHLRSIRSCFSARNYDFCYIPILKHELVSGERLHYNAPYAKSTREADFMINDNFILDYMIHPENREKIPPSLLYYHPDCLDLRYDEAENQFRGIQICAASFDGDDGLDKVLDVILRDIEAHRTPSFSIRFQKCTEPEVDEEDDDIRYRSDDDWDWDLDEVYGLDDESVSLFKEIKERIEKLQQKGIDSIIIENLFKQRRQKLSRLLVTEDYRIYLPDYFGMEINMTPLPKAVFLLFLKHPEGIMFSYLPDFREELLSIYKKVKGPFFNETEARKSIWDVTDPLSNSINEKCSRIREAFVSQFDEHLAQYYFVVGKRGEPKKIALPRNLVKWDSEN